MDFRGFNANIRLASCLNHTKIITSSPCALNRTLSAYSKSDKTWLFQKFESEMASVDGSKSVQESSDDAFQFECSPCDYEGVSQVAKFYCPQCQDYLCDSCKSAHQKISATRSHKIISGNLMPKKSENKTNEGIKLVVQCPCNGNDVTIYCKDHYEVMCIDCKALKHRNCISSTIDEASADSDTTAPNATKEHMKILKAKVENLQQRRSKDTENLTVKSAECRHIVEGLKGGLIKKMEELADTALNDIAKCDREQRMTIEQHLHTCNTALNRMELHYKPLEEAIIADINPLIFVHNLQLKKTLEQVDYILKDIENEVKEPDISFDFDETLNLTDKQSLGLVKSTLAKKQSLGVVKSTFAKETRPVVADMAINSIEKVDVNFPSDQSDPYISGSLFIPNGELILCDYSNHSVKVLDTNFTKKEQIYLSSRPWDVCLMETDEIVISQPYANSLLFMKVVPKLQTGSSIALNQVCRGLVVKNGLIYVSFDNGEIRVLDRTGQHKTNVYSKFHFQCPYYISMTTGMLYVSQWSGKNGCIKILKDGKEISYCSRGGIGSTRGMYTDGKENILVCGYFSNNLHIINANGQASKVLLSGTDGLCKPCTVSVRPNDNTLIVGGETQNLIVCKMVVF